MKAQLPEDERARIETLRRFKVLDTEPEEVFDEVTRLAALITRTPTALITLVDSDRQWFKSRFNFKPRETPRDVSFCAHAILQPGPLVVKDALDDERFRDNPLVLKDPYIRFYAGFPLTSAEGHRLGTLCVLDRERRILFTEQLEAMERLSKIVMALLEARRTVAFLEGALNARRERIAELERARPSDGAQTKTGS
jgi:GAF domain-containing protein